MRHANERPRRKRLRWESRCEIVAKVRLQGMSTQRAAASSGVHRSTVYRLLARFEPAAGRLCASVARCPSASHGAARPSSRRPF